MSFEGETRILRAQSSIAGSMLATSGALLMKALAIVTGMGVADVSENGVALGWDEVKLPNPLFAGDTLYSESHVLEKRESRSNPKRGVVKVRTRGIQQEGKVVIDYVRSVLVWKKAHAPARDLFPTVRE